VAHKVRDLAAEVGANPNALQPEDLVAMASLLDGEADEDDGDDEDLDE
jgi:hypothetical protein